MTFLLLLSAVFGSLAASFFEAGAEIIGILLGLVALFLLAGGLATGYSDARMRLNMITKNWPRQRSPRYRYWR